MDALNFFDILLAVIVGNSAIVMAVFVFMRLRQRNAWDWFSAGAAIYAGAILMIAGYYST